MLISIHAFFKQFKTFSNFNQHPTGQGLGYAATRALPVIKIKANHMNGSYEDEIYISIIEPFEKDLRKKDMYNSPPV